MVGWELVETLDLTDACVTDSLVLSITAVVMIYTGFIRLTVWSSANKWD